MKLDCEGCPASIIRDEYRKHFEKSEDLRNEELKKIKEVKLYILGESIPAKRFVYNRNDDYSFNGLRYYLKKELVPNGTHEDLFNYLIKNGVFIADCALCPLHLVINKRKILTDAKRKEAATICLRRHNIKIFEINVNAPIVTIIPTKYGFDEEELPKIQTRVVKRYSFTHLNGLRETIEKYVYR